MGVSRRAFMLAPLAFAPPLITARPALGEPLWPGARYNEAQRLRAVRRGLDLIYRVALNPTHFASYGDDLLWCFYSVARATSDEEIKRSAWTMALERARHWRRLNPRVTPGASATDLISYTYGSLAGDGLGLRDDQMKADIQSAVSKFGPHDFLKFDPAKEIAPADVPEECDNCQSENPRGRARCRTCGRALTMKDPYDVLCDALVTTYTGDSYGVTLGSTLADVMQVVPKMRPYDDPAKAGYERFSSIAYAVTHIVYALNDYGVYRLDPEWLPQEFEYLKTHLRRTIAEDDAELAGEFLDSLKSFGLTPADPTLRAGIEFVMSKQNRDGSWGDPTTGDIYDVYHPTWTVVCGLMEYAWRDGVAFPDALARARQA